jgi:hypothetical protein
MNTGAGDPGDFNGLPNDAFNANVGSGPVCRDASTPLQQRDWQALALYLPFSASGNSWAGLSSGNTSSFSPGLRR